MELIHIVIDVRTFSTTALEAVEVRSSTTTKSVSVTLSRTRISRSGFFSRGVVTGGHCRGFR